MKHREFSKKETTYGAIAAWPLPDEDELKAFYADNYYQDNSAGAYLPNYSDEELAQRRLRAELMIYALRKACPVRNENELFLEIGCGEGFVLKEADEKGYSICGVDFSEFALRKLHPELLSHVEFGDAYKILDNHLSGKRQFRVCVMQNVLEHVIDPVELMRKVKRIIQPGGMVLVTVPNDFSRLQNKAKETGLIDREFWFLPPQHLHYFNVDTIESFASFCGYEIVDSFADFPIDFFLFHSGSNYIRNSACGSEAHKARLALDLLLAERGIEPYYQFCRALNGCGMGRNLSVLMKPVSLK